MKNPTLHSALNNIFQGAGGVMIANENEELVIRPRIDVDGKMRMWKELSGEQYRVCCPICGDRRHRLYISYAWGMDNVLKWPASKLVVCHNEGCQGKYSALAPFRGNAVTYLTQNMRAYLKNNEFRCADIKVVANDVQIEPLAFPTNGIAPANLPAGHPALKYLAERRFDPVVLYNTYGVVYVQYYTEKSATGKSYSWLSDRLFIPMDGGGWQARAIDGSTPKYFTSPGWKKSAHLYGFQQARKMPTVIVVEGVTDVWRVGPQALGLLGKVISMPQLDILRRCWGAVGIALDPDAGADRLKAFNMVSKLPNMKAFLVTLPGDKDPADCTYSQVWDCIERDAAVAGVAIRRS